MVVGRDLAPDPAFRRDVQDDPRNAARATQQGEGFRVLRVGDGDVQFPLFAVEPERKGDVLFRDLHGDPFDDVLRDLATAQADPADGELLRKRLHHLVFGDEAVIEQIGPEFPAARLLAKQGLPDLLLGNRPHPEQDLVEPGFLHGVLGEGGFSAGASFLATRNSCGLSA